jgi:hypothetical protein
MFTEAFSLDSQGHSPHPRGEDLLQQLYACDELQYEIQHLEAWTPTDSVISITGKKRRRICTEKVTKQSLSDYAQQDWPIVTMRSDF